MPTNPPVSGLPANEPPSHAAGNYRAMLPHLRQGYCRLELLLDEQGAVADCRFLEVNAAFAEQTGLVGAVGHTLRALRPQAEAHWLALLGEAARTGQAQHVEQPTRRFGARWLEVDVLPFGPAGSAQVAVLLTDVTVRHQAEQQAEHRAFRLALADALRPLTDPGAVEEAATRLALDYFGADRCYYCELRDGQAIIRRDAARGEPPAVAGTYAMAQFPLLQVAIGHGRPFVVEDVRTSARVDEDLRQLCVPLEVVSFLNVPVLKQGRAVGVLCVGQRTPRAWTALEAELATEVAERTWAAVEQARSETSFAASEANHRTLFDALNEGVTTLEIMLDENERMVDGRYLETNAACLALTGLTSAILGRRFSEVTPNLEPFWYDTYERVVKTGQPERGEHQVAETNRWLDLHVARVGEAGSRTLVVVYTDITGRKRREAHLAFVREVDRAFARLRNPADMMNALGEKLAAYLGLSACAFAELTESAQVGTIRHGWSRADRPSLLGTYRMAEFVAPEVLRRCQAGEAVIIRDVWADPLTDGPQYAALNIGSFVSIPLIQDDEWRLLLVGYRTGPYDWPADEIALLHEVTARVWTQLERTNAEKALRQSEEQLRLFVTASSDVLYRMDADWQRMLRLDGKGFLADTTAPYPSWLESYIPPADRATVGATIAAAIAGRQYFELEHRVFQADGSVGWTFSRAVPLLNEHGEITEWFGAATDVTARRQAEELRQRLAQQQQLFEAVQAAQETERKRMAENLHNGIGQILYATKLRLDSLPPYPAGTDPTFATVRHEAGQLLADAIRQTRALSHELVPLLLEEFGLAAALQDICQKTSTIQLRLRCAVQFDAAAPPLPLPLQLALYRMAQELAQNILKHAHGATEASLELETTPEWVLLRAEDNGVGFADAATSSGLGLRSIRDRVALLGGQLATGSAPGGGAYVRIRLPLPPFPAL